MSLTLEQWALVLSAIAAWVALAISLYNLWQGRPRRRVEADLSVPVDLRRSKTLGEFVVVTFINERGPLVVIHEVGFEYADDSRIPKSSYTVYDRQLPTEVVAGHSANYYFDSEELRSLVREVKRIPVRAYCRDATGRYYKTSLRQTVRSALLE